MKKLITGILVLGLSMVIAVPTAFAAVQTGDPAPDFTLQGTDGQTYSLSELQGQYVVLEWLNHDCPFVKKHYESMNMQKLQKHYGEKGVVWLSVSSSAEGKQGHYPPPEANKLTEMKEASPKAVLMDFDGAVGQTYGAKTTPHMYIIDPEGVLIYQGAIDDTPSADTADIPQSTNYVQMALDEAMAGKSLSHPTTKSYGCSVKY